MNFKKFPLWTAALPIIFIAAGFQLTYDLGEQGKLRSLFLREKIYPIARSVNGAMTNIKFRTRGPMPPKNKIVVVEADDNSINTLGRWPWHRDIYAQVIHSIFKLGAKQVGLDVAFSEPEERIPPDVYKLVGEKYPKLLETMQSFEGDPLFAQVVEAHKKNLILGFSPVVSCQPLYETSASCPVEDEDLNKIIREELDRFALAQDYPFSVESIRKSPLRNVITAFTNIAPLRNAAEHAGFFYIDPDTDGYIRRYPLFLFHQNKIYPSLATQMAELVRDDQIKLDFTDDGLIKRAYFEKDPDHPIPVTPLGYIDLNFRGARESFTYVSVIDVLKAVDTHDEKVIETLKDASVFFGVTAVGLYDMRAFPFDENTAGVEGHATAADNLISNDELRSASAIHLQWLPIVLLFVIGILFSVLFSQLEAIPSLIVFVVSCLALGVVDIKVLFAHDINLPTAFLFLENMVIFAFMLSIRYILEEQNKKFVREAFSKYLAPSVVDLVLKDPSKLAVGGERRELTVVFSDLRGFTTFSEKMDPKTLSQFLNEYLSEMTEVIFEQEGTLDKYIGDAIMAFWGAPLHQKDHTVRAWNAAVEMQRRLRKVAPVYKEKYGIEVSTGVGINAGEVSVGNMGSKRIFEYTVIGDHVNLASRLESLTRTYGCDTLSTMSTVELLPAEVRPNCFYRIIDSVIVKGKTQAIDLIEVCEDAPDPKLLEIFYLAKVEFKARKWDEAIAHYEEVSAGYQKLYGRPDAVSEMFIKRSKSFKEDPPEENWDGTMAMRSK